jgi:hypothetical protein
MGEAGSTGRDCAYDKHVSDYSFHRYGVFAGGVYQRGGSTTSANHNNHRSSPQYDDNYDWPARGASIIKYNDNSDHTVSVG